VNRGQESSHSCSFDLSAYHFIVDQTTGSQTVYWLQRGFPYMVSWTLSSRPGWLLPRLRQGSTSSEEQLTIAKKRNTRSSSPSRLLILPTGPTDLAQDPNLRQTHFPPPPNSQAFLMLIASIAPSLERTLKPRPLAAKSENLQRRSFCVLAIRKGSLFTRRKSVLESPQVPDTPNLFFFSFLLKKQKTYCPQARLRQINAR
jgi:hypothetical protein